MHHGKHHKKTKKRKTKKGGEKGEEVKNPIHVNAEKEREERREHVKNIKHQSKIVGKRPKYEGGKRKTRKFKKHFMFNTKGKRYVAKTRKQHLKGIKLGHTHSKPHKKSKK